jgi:hypothetical protein
MPRKSNWKASETKAIRVPAHLAAHLLTLAHSLENEGDRFVQNDPGPVESKMISIQKPDGETARRVVSAPASVWDQGRRMAQDFLASPRVAALTPAQRAHLALLLAENAINRSS